MRSFVSVAVCHRQCGRNNTTMRHLLHPCQLISFYWIFTSVDQGAKYAIRIHCTFSTAFILVLSFRFILFSFCSFISRVILYSMSVCVCVCTTTTTTTKDPSANTKQFYEFSCISWNKLSLSPRWRDEHTKWPELISKFAMLCRKEMSKWTNTVRKRVKRTQFKPARKNSCQFFLWIL